MIRPPGPRQVPRRVVPPDDAISHRTHEEDRPFAAQSSRTHPELFPRSKATFQWRRGGLEQQGESHDEKILRLPHLSRPRTRPLSLTWQAPRTRVHPRFLLTSQEICLRRRWVEIFVRQAVDFRCGKL